MLARNKKYFNFIASPYQILRRIPRGWRFVFGGIIIFCLLAGISPLDIFRTMTQALNDNTKTINLYAGECVPEAVSENYDQGWWNAEMAVGEPGVGPEENILVFNDTNSAFYAGGNHSLVCGEFMFKKSGSQNMVSEEATNLTSDPDDNQEGLDEENIESAAPDENGGDGGVSSDNENTEAEEGENIEDKINQIIEDSSEAIGASDGGSPAEDELITNDELAPPAGGVKMTPASAQATAGKNEDGGGLRNE